MTHTYKRSQVPFQPEGMATGIGSLPFLDPNEALTLIREYMPDIPHWPQLPQASPQEYFVHQFLQPLVDCKLLVNRGDRWVLNASQTDTAECLTDFYTTCLPAEEGDGSCLQRFTATPAAARGLYAFVTRAQSGGFKKARYIKGQIVGPLTVSLELKDEQERPAYYQGDLRDSIIRTLALSARCQASALSGLGCTPIIFVDDPAVRAYGSRLHLSLSRAEIIQDLNFIFSAIQSENALAGIHSCEALDWSLLMETQAQILSLDVYRFGDSLVPYKTDLERFIRQGGVVAWGIVPTLDDPFSESVESLLKRLLTVWHELFGQVMEPDLFDLIRGKSMITPACGTGLLTKAQARRVYQLTRGVSEKLRTL